MTTRRALAASSPAILTAVALLLPWLEKPFGIDDPVFLLEAEQVLRTPLSPTAFDIDWNDGGIERASRFLPGGPVIAYILVPVIVASGAEWVGHTLMLGLLMVALFITARLALVLGYGEREARTASLLVVASPAVIGMTATVMPDVPGLLFTTLALDRALAWGQRQRRRDAVLMAVWLALAALTRIHLLLLLGPASIAACLPRLQNREFAPRDLLYRVAPLMLTPILILGAFHVTRDPSITAGTPTSAAVGQTSWHYIVPNLIAFFTHWVFFIALVLPFVALYGRLPRSKLLIWTIALVAAATLFATSRPWVLPILIVSALVLTEIVRSAITSGDAARLMLATCLFVPIPALWYIHFPAKLLVPIAPAAALLLVAHSRDNRPLPARRWALLATVIIGAGVGLLVVRTDTAFAHGARSMAHHVIAPHVGRGENVWISGHWGLHWYGPRSGARVLSETPPLPQEGDLVVQQCSIHGAHQLYRVPPTARTLIAVYHRSSPGLRVMSYDAGAGFYSNYKGLLPIGWSSTALYEFRVWRITAPYVPVVPGDSIWATRTEDPRCTDR